MGSHSLQANPLSKKTSPKAHGKVAKVAVVLQLEDISNDASMSLLSSIDDNSFSLSPSMPAIPPLGDNATAASNAWKAWIEKWKWEEIR